MPGQGRGRIRVEAHVESALLELPVIGQLAALCERRLADGEAPQPQPEGRVFPSSEGRFGPNRGFQPVRRRHHRGGRAAVVVPRRPHRGRARADGGALAEPVHRARWMSGGADIGRHRVAPEATLILEGARGEGTGDDGPVNARRCGSEEGLSRRRRDQRVERLDHRRLVVRGVDIEPDRACGHAHAQRLALGDGPDLVHDGVEAERPDLPGLARGLVEAGGQPDGASGSQGRRFDVSSAEARTARGQSHSRRLVADGVESLGDRRRRRRGRARDGSMTRRSVTTSSRARRGTGAAPGGSSLSRPRGAGSNGRCASFPPGGERGVRRRAKRRLSIHLGSCLCRRRHPVSVFFLPRSSPLPPGASRSLRRGRCVGVDDEGAGFDGAVPRVLSCASASGGRTWKVRMRCE